MLNTKKYVICAYVLFICIFLLLKYKNMAFSVIQKYNDGGFPWKSLA